MSGPALFENLRFQVRDGVAVVTLTRHGLGYPDDGNIGSFIHYDRGNRSQPRRRMSHKLATQIRKEGFVNGLLWEEP